MGENGRKILVAIDQSDESEYALSWCLKNLLCKRNSDDTFILLFAKMAAPVYTAMDSTGYMFTSSMMVTMEKQNAEVAEKIVEKAKQVCKDFNETVNVETMIEHGDPRDVICDVAEKLKVDVLVMGSHGYGVIKRALLGSVSNYCAHNVKCPILIVKKPPKTNVD